MILADKYRLREFQAGLTLETLFPDWWTKELATQANLKTAILSWIFDLILNCLIDLSK